MGVRYPSVQSNVFVGPLPASAAETVILVTPPLTLPIDFATVFLFARASIVAGTGTTSFQFRLRRGTTVAGTQVVAAQSVWTVAAGNTQDAALPYFDTPGAVAGQQYCLTVAQIGATAAGTFNDGALMAFAL